MSDDGFGVENSAFQLSKPPTPPPPPPAPPQILNFSEFDLHFEKDANRFCPDTCPDITREYFLGYFSANPEKTWFNSLQQDHSQASRSPMDLLLQLSVFLMLGSLGILLTFVLILCIVRLCLCEQRLCYAYDRETRRVRRNETRDTYDNLLEEADYEKDTAQLSSDDHPTILINRNNKEQKLKHKKKDQESSNEIANETESGFILWIKNFFSKSKIRPKADNLDLRTRQEHRNDHQRRVLRQEEGETIGGSDLINRVRSELQNNEGLLEEVDHLQNEEAGGERIDTEDPRVLLQYVDSTNPRSCSTTQVNETVMHI